MTIFIFLEKWGDTSREDIYHGVCFHAQQATEKALKALILLKTSKLPPRILC